MKKKLVFFIALLTMFVMSCIFAACADKGVDNVTAYMVRFNNNYDGTVTSVEVEENKTVTLIESPSRTGYEFLGWYLSADSDAAEKFDETKPITCDVTVFAKWKRDESVNLVTLKYLNLRTPDGVFAVDKNTAFAKPENPVYDEDGLYKFDNWYTDEGCTSEYDFSTVLSGDLTLYAGWIQVKAVIKFDANYAGAPKADRVIAELGKPMTPPANPQREMYEFQGWYTQRVGGDEIDFNEPVSGEFTAYGHWLRSEYFVTFDANGATLAPDTAKTYVVKRGQSAIDIAAEFVTNLTYEGHDFGGWYKFKIQTDAEVSDADKVDLSSINDDITAFAYWTLHEYTVSFNYAYDGAPANPPAQTVKYGNCFEAVATEREGYIFTGWYTDNKLTTQFAPTTPVTSDLTLYAGWMEKPVETTYLNVTYQYKLGSSNVEYTKKQVELGSSVEAAGAPDDPVVDGYYFAGWFVDDKFTSSFNASQIITQDTVVYGKMLTKYTLEAEACDFTGKVGQGTSTNSHEAQMIYGQSFIGDGTGKGDSFVSNGWFVRELYYNGATLEFEVISQEDVTDAIMLLRVSSESYEFEKQREKNGKLYNYMTDEEFKIYVNPTYNADREFTSDPLKYGGLYIPRANMLNKEDLSAEKTPFEDCLISTSITLRKGINTIVLRVDNNLFKGGTYHAEAPMIDCMYICASEASGIYMNDYEFYKLTAADGEYFPNK